MLSKQKKIVLLIIYVVGMFILPLFVMGVAALFVGVNPDTMTQELVRLSTTSIVVSYGVLMFLLLILTKNVFKQDFIKINSLGNFIKQMFVGILCTYSAVIVGGLLVQLFGASETAANQAAVESALNALPIGMIFSVVIAAPIVEEIIFRLVIMQLFNSKPVYNIIFSSLVFGLMHVISGGLIHIIPYFLMGTIFGFIYYKNDNIWHATILHMLHNGLSVLLLFVGQGV